MIKKIRAVVVDDSAFMRKSISIMLESDPDIEVVGTAKDGLEGYELISKIRPDIATLDVEMPRMDGITALKKIMEDCPTSVIMVSSLTTEGAEQTIKALELGAVDFIPKELSYVSINIVKIKEDLIRKVKEIVKQKSVQIRLRRLQAPAKHIAEPHVKTGEIEYLPKMDYKAIA
ncbi:MAG TPA: response regulator [Ignavibacteriales bacterium]|nr:response regulator [Ignavibacteriales bacterium]